MISFIKLFLFFLLVISFFTVFPLYAGNQNTEEKWEEFNTDRPGGDYKNFRSSEGAASCREACKNDSKCRSYTFVKPGFQGKEGRCFLKSLVASPIKNRCCISGVKEVQGEMRIAPPGEVATIEGEFRRNGNETVRQTESRQAMSGALIAALQSREFETAARQKIDELKLSLRSASMTETEKSPREVIGGEIRGCDSPIITSVWPDNTVHPGKILYVEGCGFSANTAILMYDPKGPNDAFAKPFQLIIRKQDTERIEAVVRKVESGALHPFTKPLSVAIRAHDWSKPSRPYSNFIQLVLEPNMDIYELQGITAAKIEMGGPSYNCDFIEIVDGGKYTVAHYTKKNSVHCYGIDTIVAGFKLSEYVTFEGLYFSSSDLKSVSPVNFGEASLVETDLDSMKGKSFVPRIQVSWRTLDRGDSAVAYEFVVFVKAPEGFASITP